MLIVSVLVVSVLVVSVLVVSAGCKCAGGERGFGEGAGRRDRKTEAGCGRYQEDSADNAKEY